MFDQTHFENYELSLNCSHEDGKETRCNPDEGPLKVQASGHKFVCGVSGKPMPAIIDLGDGYILKALQKPPRGERELCFYQQVSDEMCADHYLQMLKPFLPHFAGKVDRDEGSYLKLSNLIEGYLKPCVLDLKMGCVTYDCMATPEKIVAELNKFPPARQLGFQITGMMIYDPVKETYKKLSKEYSRKLTEETMVPDGLGLFFQLEKERKNSLLNQLLCKLKKLEQWFSVQKKFSFIASSLLITYEGFLQRKGRANYKTNLKQSFVYDGGTREHTVENLLACHHDKKPSKCSDALSPAADHDQQDKSSADNVELHLIDFAHVFPSDSIDHNVLFGIQKLISCLQSLIV